MKKFILTLTILSMSCSMFLMRPERYMDKEGFPAEPSSCYDYRMCMYYVAKGKYESDCKLEFIQCCKDRHYNKCGDDQERWADQDPTACWDKLQ